MVHDAGMGGVTLEGGDVVLQGQSELSIFLCHSVDGKPGDSVSSSVLMFESHLELSKEVISGSEGDSSTRDGFFTEGVSLGQDGSISHI